MNAMAMTMASARSAGMRFRRRLISRSDVKGAQRPRAEAKTRQRSCAEAAHEPPGHHGGRHRRARHPGPGSGARDAARGWSVSWLGTREGMENKLVPPSGITLDRIGFSGLRGKGLLHTLTGGLRLLQAFWQCLGILRRRGADAVLGMGGYVCFPGGLMASLLGKPLVLVNADASLLMSNKALLPVADRVAFGFDGAAASQTKQAVVTGNPVRAEIEALPAPAERFAARSGALHLLVVGGSLGAKVLNDTLPAALQQMPPSQRPRVTHQTGSAHIDVVRQAYREAGVEAELLPFIDDMALRLAACDVMSAAPARSRSASCAPAACPASWCR